MEGVRRKRMDAETWGALLARFEQSGLSVARFCEREGLGTASFYRWRSLLEAQPKGGRTSQQPRVDRMSPLPAPGFVDLGSVASSSNDVGRMEVRLEFGGGLVLKLIRS